MLNINIGEYVYIKIADKNDIENIFLLNKLFKNDNTIDEMNLYFENNKNEIICIAYYRSYSSWFLYRFNNKVNLL